jgi:hypothetical protein
MGIFSEYNEFKYIYPPRPESTMAPDQLNEICEGWIAQPKYDGKCAVLFLNGQQDYRIYNREGKPLSNYQQLNFLELNDSSKYMVLCGEYLNRNRKGEDGIPFNHKFIIWDILVWKGRYLIGETFEYRMKIQLDLFRYLNLAVTDEGHLVEKEPPFKYEHLTPTRVDNIYMAPCYVNFFKPLYDNLVKTDLYEGMVLKKASAKLDKGFTERNNVGWQVKVRKATKNYTF